MQSPVEAVSLNEERKVNNYFMLSLLMTTVAVDNNKNLRA